MESGEIPVIVPFPIKRDNSVNGTVREHPLWRRCWCARLPCAAVAGAPHGGRAGAALQWSPRPARARGAQRGARRQHARGPAVRRRAPRPALDGKRPLAGCGVRWRPGTAPPCRPRRVPAHPAHPAPLHAPGLRLPDVCCHFCSNFVRLMSLDW